MGLRRKVKSNEFTGFLDHGTSLTGELQFSGTLRVDGNIHGSVTTSDLLIVGERATVHADIKAGEVQIFGAIFGNVESKRRVEIFPTGRLRGDVRTPQLIIDEGATFEGRSRTASDSDGSGSESTEGTDRAASSEAPKKFDEFVP